MKYDTKFTDEQLVDALRAARAAGASRDVAADRVEPPNLCAFLNNLPGPERERLIDLAYAGAAEGLFP